MADQHHPKDHWTPEAYLTSASFVPSLATTILEWLNPQPDDIILDLGCGDGALTSQLKRRSLSVTGVDASANLITAAKKAHAAIAGLSFHVHDCRYLARWVNFQEAAYTKVFSNAALHWILRDPSSRTSVLRDTYAVLKPGGAFAFEMGGAGNCAEAHTALMAAVVRQGVSIQDARELCPWFFPSESTMRRMLLDVGFSVEKTEVEYRSTKLTAREEDGGGIEGWVRLMGARFLDALDSEEKREVAVREVCELLKTVITHGDEEEEEEEEDDGMFLGYVRLRVLARKPI
ncbi:MAG: hypothetical protein Q9177_003089 [Variospora cf. flavescens]